MAINKLMITIAIPHFLGQLLEQHAQEEQKTAPEIARHIITNYYKTNRGDTTHNGFKNKATWLVSLHLTNDPTLYSAAKAKATNDKAANSTKAIYTFVENILNLDLDGSLLPDLMEDVLRTVDWEHVRDDLLELEE